MKLKKFTRKYLLNQDSKTKWRNKLVLNFCYHPAYSRLNHILWNINLLLTPDAQHPKVFPKCLLLVLRGGKVWKICWLRQKLQWKKKHGKSCGCPGKRYIVCTSLEEKNTFSNKDGGNPHKIREGLYLSCNSENVIYLITCKKRKKQYVGSFIIKFHTRFNNYRSCHRKFCRGHSVIQASFHANFMLDGHCGIHDWKIILIDKGRNKQEARKKSFLGNISWTLLYHMEKWTLNRYDRMKEPFWINFELGQKNSVSHFCLIAGVELFDCSYRVLETYFCCGLY